MPSIPRFDDDYTAQAAAARRAFVTSQTGASLDHVGQGSIDPAGLRGNVEHFTGVAQVPIGIAGPLPIDGEHVQGEVYVPLATTEGTLVASYNRGMKLLRACGGVKTTVVKESMQRAPVFIFDDARGARAFEVWLREHADGARAAAESTTRTGRLSEIETYLAGRFCFTRFDYTTGDAAGQNMTGKATWAACEWIRETYPGGPVEYALEANLATDKKHSQINTLHTRGRRVIAEALIPGRVLEDVMGTTAEALYRRRQISGGVGAWLSGSVNNGAHSANGITALFIATGQDVANVAESHAAHVYSELRGEDYYYSITLPSLICATHGGGTGLPTQRECLRMLGCEGPGTVLRLCEIIAATVVAGELSLGSAIVAGDWVTAHDRYGRNR